MERVSMIGIDLAKNSFQAHGARADGSVAFRRKLSRAKILDFMASQPRCTVVMEACASAHYWGREIGGLGHAVRLIPPVYVKAYVKRQKNDAEAICEAASRPTMRFVAVKTKEQQARGMLFRTRDLLVRQRTQTTNALRGHLAEFGVVAPKGPVHIDRLASALEVQVSDLPEAVCALGGLLFEQIEGLNGKIGDLEREIHTAARQDEDVQRLTCLSMKVRSPMPCSCSCLSPTRSQRRRRELHGADSDMAQRLETAMAHTLRLGSLAELHG